MPSSPCFKCIRSPLLTQNKSIYFFVVKSVSRFDEPLFWARLQLHASTHVLLASVRTLVGPAAIACLPSARFPHAHVEDGSLFSVEAFSHASIYMSALVHLWRKEKAHTALERGLLSARASGFLSAHAGAVVTSAADHFGDV